MIIGFVGLKKSGKTTACNFLKENLIGDVVLRNFKDGLVEEMKENLPDVLKALGVHYNISIDELFTLKPTIMRELMQNYGTEVRRNDDVDYWVKKWESGLDDFDDIVLVDDVRFLNEAETIKNKGGILIRLYRGDLVNTDRHSSEIEQEMIDCNYRIVTCLGEVSKLESELLKIVKGLKLI